MADELQVADVRDLLGGHGVLTRNTDNTMIARVIDHCEGLLDVAAEAILLKPRPSWLCDLIGQDLMSGDR